MASAFLGVVKAVAARPSGRTSRRFTATVTTWSETREPRAIGRYGDHLVAGTFLPQPLLVPHRLTGFDQSRLALLEPLASSAGTRSGTPSARLALRTCPGA